MTRQEQGAINRAAGERLEINILRKQKRFALEACRSAGSHGLFDIWVMQDNKLRVILARRNGYFTWRERRDLIKFLKRKPSYVQVEVHFYKSPKKVTKRIIKSEADVVPQFR